MAKDISFATFNLYNLQLPGKFVYTSKVKHSAYDDKIAWSSGLLTQLDADVIAFQELWSKDCLADLFKAAGLQDDYNLHFIGPTWGGIAVAAAVGKTWKVIKATNHKAFPEGFRLIKRKRGVNQDKEREDDEIDIRATRFTRTIIQLTLQHKTNSKLQLEVFCVHLKAKLPTNLDKKERQNPLLNDHAAALGSAISTIRRTAEAAALRLLLDEVTRNSNRPVVVMGDFNDGVLSNTLSIITGQPPYKLFQAKALSRSKTAKSKRDMGLYSAVMLQQYHALRDVHYSHNYQGVQETLDHILVSEEFYDHSPNRIWSFKAMRLWNDHVDEHDPRERAPDKKFGDHGIVRAQFVFDRAGT